MQEFDLEIRDKKGCENFVADNLSRLKIIDSSPIQETFPDEQILAIQTGNIPWFAHIVNYWVHVGEIVLVQSEMGDFGGIEVESDVCEVDLVS